MKELEVILFSLNEKANMASKLMTKYKDIDPIVYMFNLGQYMAFNEMYSLLKI